MKKKFKLFLIVLIIIVVKTTTAQRKTEFGLSGGVARFYPEAQNLGSSRNNSMDNGWGWSAGIFLEDHWKPKIHQIVELNYYGFKSDVFLEKIPVGGGYSTGSQPIYGHFDNTSFNQIAVSGGIKYQRMVYDITVPFASTHRNNYLQLKAQVPLFNLRK